MGSRFGGSKLVTCQLSWSIHKRQVCGALLPTPSTNRYSGNHSRINTAEHPAAAVFADVAVASHEALLIMLILLRLATAAGQTGQTS